MVIENIHVKDLTDMFQTGADNLSAHAAAINALNVFPVPDGDTGTNMSLTIASGVRELKAARPDTIGEAALRFAKGLLMGARGNSGVILSQLFRGFSQVLKNHRETISADVLAEALQAGVETAYKAVMKPVEGTILTVAREAAKAGLTSSKKTKSVKLVMQAVVNEAKATLQRTPDMLPLLKEVGVVDSGGQGLLVIYQGFLSVLSGETPPTVVEEETEKLDDLVRAEHHKNNHTFMKTEEIVYGFCTEFMVRFSNEGLKRFNEASCRKKLSTYGDSLLVVADEELLKVHIHSEKPGDVLNLAQSYGELIKIKIENMREQHAEMIKEEHEETPHVENQAKEEMKLYGIVTVVPSDGIAELFRSLGASEVIAGGQSMNPSTENLIEAIEGTGAKQVLVLPNNGNIVLAAKQAAEVAKAKVKIIETKTIPQGLSALMAFSPDRTLTENAKTMTVAIKHVKSGQVTKAVRNTTLDGLAIQEGNYIGLFDGTIVTTSEKRKQSVLNLLEKMVSNDDEILTLICGESVSNEEKEQLVEQLEAKFEALEIEVHHGGQPLYDYLLAVE